MTFNTTAVVLLSVVVAGFVYDAVMLYHAHHRHEQYLSLLNIPTRTSQWVLIARQTMIYGFLIYLAMVGGGLHKGKAAGMALIGGVVLVFLGERDKKQQEKRAFHTHLPDFLDFLDMALLAGFSFSQSWTHAASYVTHKKCREAFQQWGYSLESGVPYHQLYQQEISPLLDNNCQWIFLLIGQSLEKGIALQGFLRNQAAFLRTQGLLAQEKKAQTMSTRLLLPIVVFMLPTFFILIFLPIYRVYTQNSL